MTGGAYRVFVSEKENGIYESEKNEQEQRTE
jgi:hypothetical protein